MTRRLIALGFFMIVAAAAIASADEVPSVETVLAKAHAAVGDYPKALNETITYTNGSFSGKFQRIDRGDDYREISDDGPLHSEEGSFHGEAWHQNENGQTVADYPDRADPGKVPTTTTIARVTKPIDAYVIATLTKQGTGTRDFYDPETFFNVRSETLTPNGRVVDEYHDFKAFGSRHLAARWTTTDERTKLVTTYERVAYSEADPGDDALQTPSNRRRLLEFPAGTSFAIPATLTRADHWIVRVTVAGRGLDFILDSGASGIAFNTDVARELHLAIVNQFQNSANAGSYRAGAILVPEMSVGPLRMRNVVAHVAPIIEQPESDIKAVGLLGFDFLAEAQFSLDYEHRTITVRPYEEAVAPNAAGTTSIPIRLNAQTPYVTTVVNTVKADRIVFDTGGIGSLMFFDSFVKRHPDALPDSQRRPGSGTLGGVGGEIPVVPYVVPHVVIGRFDLKDYVALRVQTDKAYATGEDGILGPGFFNIFTVTLDYPHGVIYLTPNGNYHAAKR